MTEHESALKSRLTPEFLATLLEAGKVCGWGVDYVEVAEFVKWCFCVAEQPCPSDEELEPYPFED